MGQKFIVSRAENAKWETGLRSNFTYRPLGLEDATDGAYGAQVVRVLDNSPENAVGSRHHHSTGFHFFFVVAGEGTFWFEGEGEYTFKKGDVWMQPDGIVHAMRGCSEEFEVLEINTPGEFETYEDE